MTHLYGCTWLDKEKVSRGVQVLHDVQQVYVRVLRIRASTKCGATEN